MAINWDLDDPFGEEEEEFDENEWADRRIDEMKEDGDWPWWKR